MKSHNTGFTDGLQFTRSFLQLQLTLLITLYQFFQFIYCKCHILIIIINYYHIFLTTLVLAYSLDNGN